MFKTLLKYELKKQFPTRLKKEKADIVGAVVSFSVTALIVAMFIFFLSIIAKNYMLVRLDKVSNPLSRAYELLNLFYLLIFGVMFFLSLENMRKTLNDKTDKQLMLKLPVKEQTMFLTKMLVLLIKSYAQTLLLVIPTNIIVYMALMPSALFWLATLMVVLVFPIIVFLFASIFIVPYIMFINFIRNKYILIFIIFSLILVGGVLAYAGFLQAVQSYLETGYIKFLFNEKFVLTLQSILIWAYPTNALAGICVGADVLRSVLVVVACVAVAVVLCYYISKRLYHITLYKTESKTSFKKQTKIKQHSPILTLIKKEFISISREPKHIFSYLVVATIMPVLVYCCYSLFESLISNMLGIQTPFALALLIVVVFSVLTNTFCATNITREGTTLLKQKTFPIKASSIMYAKVLFCSVVSITSAIISCVVLIAATSLSFWDGVLCVVVGGIFTISQILIATKMDLKNTRMSFTFQQAGKASSTTISKVVAMGLAVAGVAGIASLILGVMSKTSLFMSLSISPALSYIIPVAISAVYMGFAVWYYCHKLQQALDNITT